METSFLEVAVESSGFNTGFVQAKRSQLHVVGVAHCRLDCRALLLYRMNFNFARKLIRQHRTVLVHVPQEMVSLAVHDGLPSIKQHAVTFDKRRVRHLEPAIRFLVNIREAVAKLRPLINTWNDEACATVHRKRVQAQLR